MSPRSRLTVSGVAAAALVVSLVGCGGTTVEGEAPEVSPDSTPPATETPFAQERPVKPTGPVPPPPPPTSDHEPMPGEADPPPPAEDPAEADPEEQAPPETVTGDFVALLDRRGVALPEGVHPVSTATEACGRFDGGQQMDEVSGWLGEHARLDPDGQGYFLGAAVGTFCPHNFSKLG